MDVVATSPWFDSLISDLPAHGMHLLTPADHMLSNTGPSSQGNQHVPGDMFVRHEYSERPRELYLPPRPSAGQHAQSQSDDVEKLLQLLGSLAEGQSQDGSLLLRVRQAVAFAVEARGVAESLPEQSQEDFSNISLKMIRELLRDARILFKTMVEFARQARKLGLQNQPVFGRYLKVVGKLLDAVPELMDTFVPAFTSVEAGETDDLAANFLNQIGWGGQQLNTTLNFSMTASFLAEVEVVVDGGNIHIELRASASVEVSASASVQQADPIVIDTDGDGVCVDPDAPFVPFDITGDGTRESVQLPGSESALLALDSNNNGAIDGGQELFGTQLGAPNGFEELAKHDLNQDRIIDLLDPVFERLLLFTDSNCDGRSQPDELTSLLAAGISSLSLDYIDVLGRARDEEGLAQHSRYTRDAEHVGGMWDVLLNYIPA